MPKPAKNSPPPPSLRRFMSRSEAVTLGGMVVTVFSLFLTWRVIGPPDDALAQSSLLKLYTFESGFNLRLHWPLLGGAVLSSLALLWPLNEKNRLPLACLQCAGGLICFLIALRFLALQPGVLLGVLGGAMLIFGAVDRFSASTEPDGVLSR